MTDLIATLEGMTAPSREVDADIFQLLGGDEWDRAYLRAQEPCGCPRDLAIKTTRERYSPRYTASLDAITALVERVLPGWSYEVRKSGFGNGQAALWNPTMQPRPGLSIRADHASSPAIALCIALLRAKEARDAGD